MKTFFNHRDGMVWQAMKNCKIRLFWSISASHNLEYSSKENVDRCCSPSFPWQRVREFCYFWSGKTWKSQGIPFCFWKLWTWFNVYETERHDVTFLLQFCFKAKEKNMCYAFPDRPWLKIAILPTQNFLFLLQSIKNISLSNLP